MLAFYWDLTVVVCLYWPHTNAAQQGCFIITQPRSRSVAQLPHPWLAHAASGTLLTAGAQEAHGKTSALSQQKYQGASLRIMLYLQQIHAMAPHNYILCIVYKQRFFSHQKEESEWQIDKVIQTIPLYSSLFKDNFQEKQVNHHRFVCEGKPRTMVVKC